MAQLPSKTRQSVKKSYEVIAKDWDRLRGVPWPVLTQFFEIFGCFNLFSNDSILDLGCGNGRHTLKFAETTGYVVGVDFSFNLLKLAVKKQISQGFTNVSYVMADITALPFRETSFNSVLLLATLHHIPKQNNRVKTLKEIEKILEKGGHCLISVWRKWQKRFFGYFLKRIFIHMFKFNFTEFGDSHVPWKLQHGEVIQRFYHLFSRSELKKILRKTSFQIILLKIFGGPTDQDNIFAIIKKDD